MMRGQGASGGRNTKYEERKNPKRMYRWSFTVLAFGTACGQVSEHAGTTGDDSSDPRRSDGSSASSPDAGGPGPSAGGSGGSPTSAAAGASGAGAVPGGGAGGTGGALGRCDIPAMPSTADPRLAAGQHAIRDYCQAIAEDPCLTPSFNGFMAHRLHRACPSVEDRVAICEIDTYFNFVGHRAECHDAWYSTIQCLAQVNWASELPNYGAVACGFQYILDPYGIPPGYGFPCAEASGLLRDCLGPSSAVGEWATCDYHQVEYNAGLCSVYCPAPETQGPPELIAAECRGPESGPLECRCAWNGVDLVDHFSTGDGTFFASTCEAVAGRVADGECYERRACCFAWTDVATDAARCECTRDPELGGYPSCEAVAQDLGGAVVERCARHEPW
jgi:hypothetical protein